MSHRRLKKNQEKTEKIRERCGICGRAGKLTRTPCCDQLICDDTDKYVLFSYARNSCYRNHEKFTLCSHHYHENHEGDWQTCEKCKNDLDTEMYVYLGTNEYNYEVLKNPPEYEPTKCVKCGKIIRRGQEAYSTKGNKCYCEKCMRIMV